DLAGRAARLTLGLQRDAASGAIVALAGAFRWVGGGAEGAGVAGAPVEIQVRSSSRRGEVVSEQTLAQAQTAGDGGFAVAVAQGLSGSPGMSLRALCPGAAGVPAAVSAPLGLTSTVSFTPPAAPSSQ